MPTEVKALEDEALTLWLDEAQRRDEAHKSGSLPSRDAFAAIAEMRGKI